MRHDQGRSARKVHRLAVNVAAFEALEARRLLSAASVFHGPPGFASTTARVRTHGSAAPAGSAGVPAGALTPAQIRSFYGLNAISLPNVATADGSGQTIAIVDAYHDPSALNDLRTFDQQFGLADPPSFLQLNENGGTTLPATDASTKPNTWELEESLDIQWAHAIAPKANIILFEANSASFNDLFTAVTTAKNTAGVSAVSMSFSTSGDFSGETSYDNIFTSSSGHGVTFLAATGDSGASAGYPATSPNVIAVGGTTITNGAESGWSGSSGSLSSQEAQPAYQAGIVTQSTTRRAAPDVSMDADPNSGVAVFDSFDGTGSAGNWFQVGGTSLATPMWSGLIAIANQGRAANGLPTYDGATQTLPRLYALPQSDFNDITTGSNRSFSATAGYDLVTGRGTPIASRLVPDLANIPSVTTPQPPTIASLSASPSPATTAQSILLTANGVADSSATVSSVSFYRESNGVAGLQTGAGGDTLVGTSNGSAGSWTATQPSGLAAGNYAFYAVATDSRSAVSTPAQTTVTVNAPSSSSLFPTQLDIGSVGRAGSGSFSNGVYTVSGSGSDIWNSSDSFHYAYTSLNGNATVIARVSSVGNTSSWAKAGIMIRETTATNSRQAIVALTPGNGVAFQWRTNTNGGSSNVNVAGPTAPYWVKLVRTSNVFTAFYSANGSTWTQLGGGVTIAMNATALVGLAVTAHNNSVLCTAAFDNVSLAVGAASHGTSLTQASFGGSAPLPTPLQTLLDDWTPDVSNSDTQSLDSLLK